MKIIHTSDWHLGRTLYGYRRYEEFAAFLDWMAEYVEKNDIDAILISGDVFDTTTPSNTAQKLYYKFLCRLSGRCTLVITGGNHDSPGFLQAPSGLLETLNIHVIGSARDNPEDEVIILKKKDLTDGAIVCAVPYLRDRDIRISLAGESFKEKEEKLVEGLKQHYSKVCDIAAASREKIGQIPVIAMGHLFTAGGRTVEGDGVRELYVGSLAHINESVFPECIDYMALGHLHICQSAGESGRTWYSGSPLPMGFNEASSAKYILQLEFSGSNFQMNKIEVPCFQQLKRISGDIDKISKEIAGLKEENSNALVEINYTAKNLIGNLRETIEEMVAGTGIEVVRIRNRAIMEMALKRSGVEETLDDLDVYQVFERCIESSRIPEDQHERLKNAYREIVTSIYEKDVNQN